METNASPKREKNPLTLAIKEDRVSVAPDGKVVVHTAVINNGAENDQVGIVVKGIPAEWVTVDNPTIYLAAGAIKQAIITIQPPPYPQSDVGEYTMEVQASSRYDPWHSATVRCQVTVVAYESEGRIGVLLGSVQFSAMPNASITIPMILKNRGVKEDVFILSVEGIPSNWVTTTTPLTRVNSSQSKQIEFKIQVPRSSQAHAGRTPFKIVITSQNFATEKVEVDSVMTVAAFLQFSATLEPESVQANQPGILTVRNEGNTVDHFSLTFQAPDNQLIFEKITQAPKKQPTPNEPKPELETVYTEILQPENLRVGAGESGVLQFRSRPRAREFMGDEKVYSYSTRIQSSSHNVSELHGQLSAKGILPRWLVTTLVIAVLLLCFLILVPGRGASEAASAAQTASANQTQAALSGQQDTDGDGLTNDYETQNGLDPANPDTDRDGLKDGDELNTYKTNPLAPDSDNDGLSDGDEVIKYNTNPLAPDSDGDLLNDGDEVKGETDPLKPDTDGDGLSDGAEAGLGTDPRKQDTDGDGLLDGQENQTCPNPLNPDTDGDGITDGKDQDVCDPNNPSLTAAAPTQPPVVPTQPQPTQPPVQQPTQLPPVGQPTQLPIGQPTELPGTTPGLPSGGVPSTCGSAVVAGGIAIFGIAMGGRRRKRDL